MIAARRELEDGNLGTDGRAMTASLKIILDRLVSLK